MYTYYFMDDKGTTDQLCITKNIYNEIWYFKLNRNPIKVIISVSVIE